MKFKLLGGATALLAVVLVVQVAAYRSHAPATTLHASWAFHPQTLGQARDHAQSIVLAQVVAVERGDDLITSAPLEPGGVDRIPTQRIALRVLSSFRGSAKVGDRLTVFQTGGTRVPAGPAAGGNASTDVQQFVLEGDPPYAAGEQYLLFLEPGPRGMLRTISPEGRYRDDNGTLTPMIDGVVAREMRGKRLVDLQPLLKAK